MKYKARVDFGGIISMSVGEVAEIADEAIAKDLLKAGYIETVKPAEKGTTKATTNKKPARAKKSGVK